MKKLDLQGNNLICLEMDEMQYVLGGAEAECLEDFWEFVKKICDFIAEYQQDIIDGFRRGWDKF